MLSWLSKLFLYVAYSAMIAMILVTVADVALNFFASSPIFGVYEVVQLLLVVATFPAMPETFLRGRHIVVELIDHLVSERTTELLRLFASFLTTAFLSVLAWFIWVQVEKLILDGEVTFNLEIPLAWGGLVILAAIVLCAAISLADSLSYARGAIRGRRSISAANAETYGSIR